MNILIIEDRPERQSLLLDLYHSHSCKVVDSAEKAIACLDAEIFDLISLDYDLSEGSNGADVAAHLSQSRNRNAPVLVHSMNPEGVTAIQRYLPRALLFSIAEMTRQNPMFGRLKSELASGLSPDWKFVTSGHKVADRSKNE